MPSIDAIAAEYVDRAAALDPFQAALAGIEGHDHEVPDLSPDGSSWPRASKLGAVFVGVGVSGPNLKSPGNRFT